jgi:hypothetical protein
VNHLSEKKAILKGQKKLKMTSNKKKKAAGSFFNIKNIRLHTLMIFNNDLLG